jgi:hypothetical protein
MIYLFVTTKLTLAAVRTDLANQRTTTQLANVRVLAAEGTSKSCQAALGQVQVATGAFAEATKQAYAATGLALQRASGRDQAAQTAITRLLSVRAVPGQDCQTALGLARGAWEDGQ